MLEENYFDSDGVKLHYIDWGGIGKSIVLLAGLGDTAQIYRGLAPKLSNSFRVMGLTRRGHGRSDRPEDGYELETFVEDIRIFLDTLEIERPILIGHSFGGLEILDFARCYPQRVEAIVYLDALFPKLDPQPDLSGDPVWSVISSGGPTMADLASRHEYLAYYKHVRPVWTRLWCEAIEADLMDKVVTCENGRLEFCHDDQLMNRIYQTTLSSWNPEYDKVDAPMLAIVPDGNFHQGVPLDAEHELKQAADQYWEKKLLPWIRQRTAVFRQAAPTARVVELDSPYHHIFIAEEDKVAEAIKDFLIV
jgi:pimeloyl-ACP methyl ester carboxylesterase